MRTLTGIILLQDQYQFAILISLSVSEQKCPNKLKVAGYEYRYLFDFSCCRLCLDWKVLRKQNKEGKWKENKKQV